MSTDLIAKEAQSFNVFDEISQYSEENIKEFVEEHKQFISENPHGFGLFIWKAKVILTKLQSMNDNDILMYCDSGTHLNIHGKERLIEYFNMINDETPLLTFGTSTDYLIKDFALIDAAMEYYPHIYKENEHIVCYAGVMILKKSESTINFISDWLKLCTNYNYLMGIHSGKYLPINSYQGCDYDNGLFGLCLAKHKIHKMIYPDECNLYIDNKQMIHKGVKPADMPWYLLYDKPIHYRRHKK